MKQDKSIFIVTEITTKLTSKKGFYSILSLTLLFIWFLVLNMLHWDHCVDTGSYEFFC